MNATAQLDADSSDSLNSVEKLHGTSCPDSSCCVAPVTRRNRANTALDATPEALTAASSRIRSVWRDSTTPASSPTTVPVRDSPLSVTNSQGSEMLTHTRSPTKDLFIISSLLAVATSAERCPTLSPELFLSRYAPCRRQPIQEVARCQTGRSLICRQPMHPTSELPTASLLAVDPSSLLPRASGTSS